MNVAQEPALVTCDHCALMSTLPATYKRVRKPKRTLCPRCWYRDRVDEARRAEVKTWITVGVVLALTLATKSWVLVNLVILPTLLLLPSIVVHELSHAVAASLLNFDVFRIRLGIGPALRELRLFGYSWDVRRYLRGGLLQCAPVDMRNLRSRFLLVVAAGPAANFVAGAAAFAVLATSYAEDLITEPAPLMMLLLINWALAFGNLVPFGTAQGHPSDGKTLLHGLSGNPQWLSTLEIGFHVARFLELRREERSDAALAAIMDAAQAHPESAPMVCNLGIAYLDARRYTESRATFERALALAKDPAEQAIVRNNLAYLFMESRSLDDLPAGAMHSAAAYAVFPWHSAVGATHALYELWAGRAANAAAIIEAALGDELQPNERKDILYMLAIAKLQVGERTAALAIAGEADAMRGDTRWQSAFARSLATDGRKFLEDAAAA